MNKKCILSALVCIAAFSFTSCIEENFEQITPALDGDEVIFGVRAGFENAGADTRTVYSGEVYTVGTGENAKKFERIDWLDQDKIEIYSPQAENPISEKSKSTHYQVTNLNSNDSDEGDTGKGSDYAQLKNVGEAGLRWNGDGNHDFYAMYPSSSMFAVLGPDGNYQVPDAILTGIRMGLDKDTESKVTVYGIIPTSQQPVVEKVTGGYVAKPDMNYAYMVAKTTDITRESGSVNLSFVPIVTAVEIELSNISGDVLSIGEIQVSSEQQITGAFTADLTSWNQSDKAYPTCTNIARETTGNTETVSDYIQITTRVKDDNGNYIPVNLQNNESLKFTVFLLPGTDITNLTVGVSSAGAGYTRKSLPGINIPKNLKTRISGLNLPVAKEDFVYGGDNWMSQLEPTVSFKALSLPGTGGSFTYKSNESFRQQSLSINDQWSQGIRAYELSSDRPSSATTTLGGESITCNKVDVTADDGTPYTVIEAVRALLNKVTTIKDSKGNPTETAALILTYQPEDNSPNRNVAAYSQSLNVMLSGSGTTGQGNTLSSEEVKNIIPYTAGLTLEGARGKLILICRPNQRDENDNGSYQTALSYLDPSKVTAVNGCGTAKDRWGARGYKMIGDKSSWEQGTERKTSWLGRQYYDWGNKSYIGVPSTATQRALDISNNGSTNTEVIERTTNTSAGGTSGNLTANDNRSGYDIAGPNYIEYFMSGRDDDIFANGDSYTQDHADWGTIGVTKPSLNDPTALDFGFETNISGLTCWFQEWARVVPAASAKRFSGTWRDGSSSASYDIRWFESYTEKLSNITTTFDMAISGDYPNYVFINSLCGYLATENTNTQAEGWSLAPSMPGGTYGVWGGAGGDIQALADLLNPAFYNHVLSSGMASKTGPTGIVLMDFVSKEEADGGAYYLPGTIISNNFKYEDGGLGNITPGDGTDTPIIPF